MDGIIELECFHSGAFSAISKALQGHLAFGDFFFSPPVKQSLQYSHSVTLKSYFLKCIYIQNIQQVQLAYP